MSKRNFHIVDGDKGHAAAAKAFADLDRSQFPDLDGHPRFGGFTYSLFRSIYPESFPDRSFVVADETGPVAAVAATLNESEISMFELPATVALASGLDPSMASKALAAIFAHFDQIGIGDGATHARLRGGEAAHLGPLDTACLTRLAKPVAKMHAVVDLAGGEDTIRRGVRDRYRSYINWGRKQMRMVYVNGENPDKSAFDSFPAFHTRIAGAGARGSAYWEVVWDWVACGKAELSLGYLEDDSLVAGTLTAFAPSEAYYALGVYDRDRFEKPIGHWPMFDAMVRAGTRGMSRYVLGEILPKGAASEKEVQIGYFKKGFTDQIVIWIEWHVPLSPAIDAAQ